MPRDVRVAGNFREICQLNRENKLLVAMTYSLSCAVKQLWSSGGQNSALWINLNLLTLLGRHSSTIILGHTMPDLEIPDLANTDFLQR